MAKVCRNLTFCKSFDLVSTARYIQIGSIEFKDLFRTELLNSLNQTDIDTLSALSILTDLRLSVSTGKAFFDSSGRQRYNNPVAG